MGRTDPKLDARAAKDGSRLATPLTLLAVRGESPTYALDCLVDPDDPVTRVVFQLKRRLDDPDPGALRVGPVDVDPGDTGGPTARRPGVATLRVTVPAAALRALTDGNYALALWGQLASGAWTCTNPVPGTLTLTTSALADPSAVSAATPPAEGVVTVPAIAAYETPVQASVTWLDAQGAQLAPQPAASWGSEDPATLEVSATGQVTAHTDTAGTRVAAWTADGVVASALVAVALSTTPASITLDVTTATVPQGGQQTLTATVRNAGGGVIAGAPVTWASGNTGVATVPASTAQAIAVTAGQTAGATTITATVQGANGPIVASCDWTTQDRFDYGIAQFNAAGPAQLTHFYHPARNNTTSAGVRSRWGNAIQGGATADFVNDPASADWPNGATVDANGYQTSPGLKLAAGTGFGAIPAEGAFWGVIGYTDYTGQGGASRLYLAWGPTGADSIAIRAANIATHLLTTEASWHAIGGSGTSWQNYAPVGGHAHGGKATLMAFGFNQPPNAAGTRLWQHTGRHLHDTSRGFTTSNGSAAAVDSALATFTAADRTVELGAQSYKGMYNLLTPTYYLVSAFRGTGEPTAAQWKILNDLTRDLGWTADDTRSSCLVIGNSIIERDNPDRWRGAPETAGQPFVKWGASGQTTDWMRAVRPYRESRCDFSAMPRVPIIAWEQYNQSLAQMTVADGIALHRAWYNELLALDAKVRLCACTGMHEAYTDFTSNNRVQVWDDIRQHAVSAGFAHAMADLQAVTPLDDPTWISAATPNTYWSDPLHPATAGFDNLAPTYQAGLVSLLTMA